MRELALFAGAGGGILGGHLLGWRTVCAVEWEPYPASVLCARQNDGILPPFPIWDDIRTFDGKPWRGIVDVVSGGFPCQDISAAGGGAGIDGARSGLWREMARIIDEVRPRFVFVENSPLLVGRGAAVVIGDLAAMGYNAQWACIAASDLGAPHQRDRFWLVAYAIGITGNERRAEPARQQRKAGSTDGGDDMANASGGRCLQSEGGEMEQPGRTEVVGAGNVPDTESQRAHGGWTCGAGRTELADFCVEVADAQSKRCGEARQLRCDESEEWIGRSRETMGNTISHGRPARRNDDGEHDRTIAYTTSEQPEVMADANLSGLTTGGVKKCTPPDTTQSDSNLSNRGGRNDWPIEPDVGRVANGVAARVDRLKAIGNGQVPRVAATAFNILSGRIIL